MFFLPGPMSLRGIMSLSCLPPNKETQTKSDHRSILYVHVADKHLFCCVNTTEHSAGMCCILPRSISGKVLSSYTPLLRVLLEGLRFTMKSVFFQPSFSSVRRSSLKPHTICSTSPAPRTSRSERLLYRKNGRLAFAVKYLFFQVSQK